jgi:lysophospholipase L1-like esterase
MAPPEGTRQLSGVSRRLFVRTVLGALLLLLIAGGWIFHREIGRTFSDDPTVWEPEIRAFERADRESPPPRDAILFVGSSSIRFWDGLTEDMAPLVVIRRGFGGAKLSDLVHYADRVIVPYAPRAIVVHAGGNELNDVPGNRTRTPEEAHADFRALVARVRERLLEVPIYYLALRPGRQAGAREPFLERVRADCAAQPNLHYLDAGAGLTGPDGMAKPELMSWDRIHLNRDGYAAWAPPVRERLLRDLGAGAFAN